jgi:poly(hydroxyalkanoate) depolymerase family esterase
MSFNDDVLAAMRQAALALRKGQDAWQEATGMGRVAAAAPAEGGTFSAHTWTGEAGALAYKVYVPEGARQAGTLLPVIVMLHGCAQGVDDFAAGTRMNRLAAQAGCIVVYPAQSMQANQMGCWNWFHPQHQQRACGEPAMIAGITREVLARHPADASRVYIAGLSAGGAMAAILAQTWPDLYVCAGIHSGMAYGAAQDAASALALMKYGRAAGDASPATLRLPLIVFHGDADDTVHARNADALVAAAGRRGQIVEQRGVTGSGRRYTCEIWRGDDGVDGEFWLVHGGAHGWFGGSGECAFTDPDGPDASREMLRFFLAHARRA